MSFNSKTGLNKPMSISYHDQMHAHWIQDPNSVDASW